MKRVVALTIFLLLLINLRVAGQGITGAQVIGTFTVGSTLEGDTLGSPESGNHVDYEWFYSPSGTSIGTNDTYIVQPTDQGMYIYVTATENSNGGHVFVRDYLSTPVIVNSFPGATYVSIAGTPKSGMTLSGTYVYSDVDSDPQNSSFRWYTGTSPGGAGPLPIGSATSQTLTLTDAEIGMYIGFYITPGATAGSTPGTEVSSAIWSGPVTANSAPVASGLSIGGTLKVGSPVTANYTYTDAEGDIEGSSEINWYCETNWSVSIGTGRTLVLTNNEFNQRIRFSVSPVALTGTINGTAVPGSNSTAVINPAPVASGLSIGGTLKVGSPVTAIYTYTDAEGDIEGSSEINWYCETNWSVSIGTGRTLVLTNNEFNRMIRFSVRPVALTGTTNGTVVPGSNSTAVTNPAPVASGLSIGGTLKVGSPVTAIYTYTDAEGDIEGSSEINWYCETNWSVSIGTGRTLVLTNSEYNRMIRFSVRPVALTGTTNGTAVPCSNSTPITNPPPVTSIPTISGIKNVGATLTGHYTYSDAEGDIENNSEYQWYSRPSSMGTFDPITDETTINHIITLSEQGYYFQFKVTPKTLYGSPTGSPETSPEYGPANTKPSASALYMDGTVAIGNTLTARYTYSDVNGDAQGTSLFRWFRDGVLISGETDSTYHIIDDDEGYKLRFEVTPVSTAGYPNTGNAVLSPETISVPLSGTLPTATQLCIEGIRAPLNVIKGKYVYTYSHGSDQSVFRWMRDNDTIPGEFTNQYTLKGSDILHDIYFVVIPKSGHPSHKKGIAEKSNSLARIKLSADSYSVADPAFPLIANVPLGVFSGPGVSSNIFTPSSAGSVASPHTILYSLSVVKPSSTCSQQASDTITVLPIDAYFDGFNNVYCHNGGRDTIIVRNVPSGSSSLIFKLSDPAGKVELIRDTIIVIDPGRMRPGDKADTLYFSYKDARGSLFPIFRPFVIDSVGTKLSLVNIDPAYCEGSTKRYVTVEGTYPGGGTANWTGTLMTDNTPTSSFLDPSRGIKGNSYTVSYQYISPNGCKSITLKDTVKINPLPNTSFTLNPTYNIDGGEKILSATISGGNFVGPGVIGTKFYPDIAGQGKHEIKYYITDINGCSSNTGNFTEVRKVKGVYNNLPLIMCYRDTTYNISVTGLPSGITVIDFLNSKNSLVHMPGDSSATYRLPYARAGYDTVRFSYTWGGVNYTLSRTVFIDSIGKIAITGLKDNYCDYEGTATLRVLVENSTGNGNFSFSGPGTAFNNYGNLADFFPSLTPTSATPYKVFYTHVSSVNNSGCKKKVESPVTVNKSPLVAITKTRTTVNLEEPPILLQGVPLNGIFSGKGIYKSGADYVFNPLVAGLGDIEILLSFVDSKGCFASDKDTLKVTLATGIIEGINAGAQYCYDGLDDTLKFVSSVPYLSGSFVGPGIHNISADEAVFNPGSAGKGDHKITYTYSDLKGTMFDVPAILKVDSVGQVQINNLNPGDVFCNNALVLQLFTTHPGGVFSGPVTGSSLDPSKEVGNTSVGYTFTNSKTGCSSTINIPVVINAAPVISFIPKDVCIENNSDTTRFTNNSTSADPVSDWLWEFTEAGGSTTSTEKEPGYLYKSGGLHKVTLTAKTVKDCSATKDITTDIGAKPVADFYWKNECFLRNDSISLFDTTFSTSLIVSRSWKIFGGAEFGTGKKERYLKSDTGYLKVQYIVRTSFAHCNDTVTKNIYIRPSISLAEDSYFQDFETGKGGWIKDDAARNSWSFGKPGRPVINTTASGNYTWFTNYDLTNQKIESSSIVSPCFDFTEVERPMIRLKIRTRFERNRDGAVLQYKVADNLTWQPVGSIDDGINWFNSPLIKARPGGDQIGWTTLDPLDTKWKESRHTLDELKGLKDVKFRIAYGSDGNSTENDGIAFDDIWIGERSRNVLLEHFTNISRTESSLANSLVNTIAQNNKKDVINIQYHTNFPGADPFYDLNPGDASARTLFYGLIKTPYTFIDGGNNKADFANRFDYNLASIDSNDVTRRSLINPLFNISLNLSISTGGILSVSGQISAIESINSDNLTLYLAVTEKENNDHTGASGETRFYNVFRKFIPDAGGINLKKTWTKGDTYALTEQPWLIDKTLNSSDIEVVAFIQNTVTKELYQASSDTINNVVVGIENLFQGKGTDFALYPNPAVNILTISFEKPLANDADIRIYDLRGVVIASYKARSGLSEFTIEDLALRSGIYMVRISSKSFDLGFRKLIISGD